MNSGRHLRFITPFLFVFVGCGFFLKGSPETEIKISPEPEPGWVKVPGEGGFVGVSGKYALERDARNNAIADARMKIVESLEVKVDSKLVEEIIVSGKTSDILSGEAESVRVSKFMANAVITGTKVEKYYVERWEKSKGRKRKKYYIAKVLIRFSKNEHDEFVRKLSASVYGESKPVFREAREAERAGNAELAIQKYGVVLGLISGIDKSFPYKMQKIRRMRLEAEKALAELKSAKKKVLSLKKEGAEALARREIVAGIEKFYEARKWLKKTPEDWSEKEEESISALLSETFRKMEIIVPSERLVYDSKGRPLNPGFSVRVFYGAGGAKEPVVGLPLKFDFSEGDGRLRETSVRTNRYGKAAGSLLYVNPEYKEAELSVGIDEDALGEKIPSVFIPYRRIILSRKQGVAYAVRFLNAGRRENPASLAENVKMALLSSKFEPLKTYVEGEFVSERDLSRASGINADYLLFVFAVAEGSTAPDYGISAVRIVESGAEMYSLPDGNLVFEIRGLSSGKVQGMGLVQTGRRALNQISGELTRKIKEKIKEIK